MVVRIQHVQPALLVAGQPQGLNSSPLAASFVPQQPNERPSRVNFCTRWLPYSQIYKVSFGASTKS